MPGAVFALRLRRTRFRLTADFAHADARAKALAAWLATTLRVDVASIAPASSDASFRRYFRVTLATPLPQCPDATLIAMDAPPPQEDCRPYVHVAAPRS